MLRAALGLVLGLFFAIDAQGAGEEWSYVYGKKLQKVYGDGPLEWKGVVPQFCNGTRQSPINIVPSTLGATSLNSSPFEFSSGYSSAPADMTIVNDGHTIHLKSTNTNAITFKGAGLTGTYKLVDVHFHWGAGPYRGSEHTIDGKPSALEMHLVHLKTSFPSVDAAKASSDSSALAVLGVLFEESKNDNPIINPIVNALPFVKTENDHDYDLPTPFPYRYLIPLESDDFYRYLGSLTTPPCNEIVAWSVFKTKMPISDRQLAKFRDITGHAFGMSDNFRPTQPLGARSIKKYVAAESLNAATCE